MTCSNGPTNSQFAEPQNDTERVRLGAITDHARHDLAARPAGKFQFVGRWDRTGRNILYYIFSWKTLQDIIGFRIKKLQKKSIGSAAGIQKTQPGGYPMSLS